MSIPPREGLGGTMSPRSFALAHQRPKASFYGSSKIAEYDFLGKLGEGTFGEVHKAKSKRTGALVALKKIIMHNEKDGFPITALREIKLLKMLDHPNVLKLEDMAVEHPQSRTITEKRKRPIMYMVTPYMDHDLSGLLDNPAVTFTVPQIKCYMLQLLEGLRYLHEKGTLHRDMKAANLLISNRGILQIADFGLARNYEGTTPRAGCGGGEGVREYTSLVVTRWYRPPELLMHLKRYTPAIDMWGVGCVFGEMLIGKPILAGDTDAHQLEIIFDLVGTPTEDTMPGWRQLPGGENLTPKPRHATLASRFSSYGSGAISLLKDLLKLDWKTRINAIDALQHSYFKQNPLAAKPNELPTFEDSHELDRRKFHDRKANLPPAPKGGTVGVGMGPLDGGAPSGFNTIDSYGPGGRIRAPRNNGHVEDTRRPVWTRGERGLPPRPPPPLDHPNGWEMPPEHDRYRDRDGGGRDRDRDRRRGPPPARNDVDTYIPSYHGRDDGPRRRRDDRDRDDRRHDWDRDRGGARMEYEDRTRTSRTRSRSRSPLRDRDRDSYRR
ncbi:uncharacterized protein MKZ38_002542 [Zalerion maritima]|uniref:Serine/threonine-protein kinase BUR1 n=1 Tax=Zalerion maritima TaxID=339359 RepID=A0AAD5RNQ0_9PEZI|nr:uncharacterized protein MKZ38_002542 [Zalerion maritima]